MDDMMASLTAFNADLDKFAKLIDVEFNIVVRRVVLSILKGVMVGQDAEGKPIGPGTPVDTGRARASWFVNSDSPGSDTAPAAAKDGKIDWAGVNDATIGSATAAIKADPYKKWWVYNNLPYIRALELGHSEQAPEGFVAIAVALVEAEIMGIMAAAEEEAKA